MEHGTGQSTEQGGHEETNPLQGYFDWQVTTLMLAYDLDQPLAGQGEEAVAQRRQRVEEEVRAMVMALLPEEYKQNASLQWPPDLMMRITRRTLQRAAEVAEI